MPILSYLVCAAPGRADDLAREIDSLEECELIESEKRDVMILVTDTRDREHEEWLQRRLEEVESMSFLALAFGHSEPKGDQL